MKPDSDPPSSVPVAARVLAFRGADPRAADRVVATETPVQIVYGTVPHAVMMATPGDLEDFAVGFSLTEGIIAGRGDIRGVAVARDGDGLRLSIDLAPGRFHALLARRRTMAGRTSCGVCGIEELDGLPRAPRRTAPAPRIALAAIERALAELPRHQALNDAAHAVHAAAWADCRGEIACAREDVGRHNALDKLVGALLTSGTDPADGFLLITSRCSYEMVEKAAAFGAGMLVAISAPTSLGVERARHHAMTLLGVARSDGVTAFTGAERIMAGAELLA